jgi:prefoldin beta subunit
MSEQEDIQSQILQLQQLQQQYESIATTRNQMELQLKEVEIAYEEVEKADKNTPIYKSAGALMVKAKDKLVVLKELTERKETLGIRVESFKKQEKATEDILRKMSQQVQERIQVTQGGGMGQGPTAN